MSIELPPAIQAFLDATADEDSDAFVAVFTDDALLVDWSRAFHGHEGVASWNESDNIGKHTRFEVEGDLADEPFGGVIATLTVSGEGYNGTGPMTFRLVGEGADQRIAELLIRPT
jgi:ketosteroid isomerase-like protein